MYIFGYFFQKKHCKDSSKKGYIGGTDDPLSPCSGGPDIKYFLAS